MTNICENREENVGDELKRSPPPVLQFTILKWGLLGFPRDNSAGHRTSPLICSQPLGWQSLGGKALGRGVFSGSDDYLNV